MNKITVFLCDDHTIFRQGLRLLLKTSEDIEVIGEAQNGQCGVREALRLRPNVVVMDIAMPLLNGLEASRQITRQAPDVKVLILSSYSDEQYVQHAIAAGASGYVMKQTTSDDILRAIRETSKGDAYFSPAIAMCLVRQWRTRDAGSNTTSAAALTTRETEVLQLIAEGHCNKQIAGVLLVSMKTVEYHRQTLMNKLDIHKTAILTRYAVGAGIVESRRYSPLDSRIGPPAAQPVGIKKRKKTEHEVL